MMVSTCKINKETDDTAYSTTAAGVPFILILGTKLP